MQTDSVGGGGDLELTPDQEIFDEKMSPAHLPLIRHLSKPEAKEIVECKVKVGRFAIERRVSQEMASLMRIGVRTVTHDKFVAAIRSGRVTDLHPFDGKFPGWNITFEGVDSVGDRLYVFLKLFAASRAPVVITGFAIPHGWGE